MEHKEIEVRFLEIDKDSLIKKLNDLGARDLGDDLLRETIFYYDKENWREGSVKFVRIRETKHGVFVAYKHHEKAAVDGAHEIEFRADNAKTVERFLEAIGLNRFRQQEKKRHTFILDKVTVDIDTWPSIPTYVELESDSEENLKSAAKELELSWSDAEFRDARAVIEQVYKLPLTEIKTFTFKKIE